MRSRNCSRRARGWIVALRKYVSRLVFLFAISALPLGAAAQEADAGIADRKAFMSASTQDILDAVLTCEANKSGQTFDRAGIRKSGWRRLSPLGYKSTEPAMFGKRRNGASITISPDEVGSDRACIIIGWVDDKNKADSARNRISDELGLTMQINSPNQAQAELEGWAYTSLTFTKPQVTDQTRVLFVIAPANVSPGSKGN